MISFFCFMLSYFAGSWTLSEIEDNISNMKEHDRVGSRIV
jgi:hypothetical protein